MEFGNRCRACAGPLNGFEDLCEPRIRIDYDTPLRAPCRVSTTAPANNQECADVWTEHPAFVTDDLGEHELPPNTPTRLTVEGQPYVAFNFFSGERFCPCTTDCNGFYSSFVMLPEESVELP